MTFCVEETEDKGYILVIWRCFLSMIKDKNKLKGAMMNKNFKYLFPKPTYNYWGNVRRMYKK